MKTETIPFPREFQPGDVGIDCRAVKRALASAMDGARGMNLKTNDFAAKTAGANLADWKLSVGLLHTPEYTWAAHTLMTSQGHFDEFGASLMAKMAYKLAAQHQRDSFVSAYRWSIVHHSQYDYRQWRPIPEQLVPFETTVRIETDCSGNVAISGKWGPGIDPSGLGFNGQGNTGTLLYHGTHISASQAIPADLIVYRKGSWDSYGHHVVAILELRPNNDFLVGSHGHEGDPGEYLHSAMLASQARSGYPDAVFLRWLPVP